VLVNVGSRVGVEVEVLTNVGVDLLVGVGVGALVHVAVAAGTWLALPVHATRRELRRMMRITRLLLNFMGAHCWAQIRTRIGDRRVGGPKNSPMSHPGILPARIPAILYRHSGQNTSLRQGNLSRSNATSPLPPGAEAAWLSSSKPFQWRFNDLIPAE
jgi:hypothetical protein